MNILAFVCVSVFLGGRSEGGVPFVCKGREMGWGGGRSIYIEIPMVQYATHSNGFSACTIV